MYLFSYTAIVCSEVTAEKQFMSPFEDMAKVQQQQWIAMLTVTVCSYTTLNTLTKQPQAKSYQN